MKKMNHRVLRKLGKIFAWLVILFILLHAAISFFLSQVNHFRESAENFASEKLSAHVSIRYMTGSLGLLNPQLILKGVSVSNEHGETPPQRIETVKVILAVIPSILSGKVVLKSSYIDNARFTIIKNKKHWFFEGFNQSKGKETSPDYAIWPILENIIGLRISDSQFYFVNQEDKSINELSVNRLLASQSDNKLLVTGHLTLDSSPVDVTASLSDLSPLFENTTVKARVSSSSVEAAPWINLFIPEKVKAFKVNSFPVAINTHFYWSRHTFNIKSELNMPDSTVNINKKAISTKHLKGLVSVEGKSLDQFLAKVDVSDFLINDMEYPTSSLTVEKKTVNNHSVIQIMLPETNVDALKRGVIASDLLSDKTRSTLLTLNPFGKLHNTVITLFPGTYSEKFSLSTEFKNLSVNAWRNAPAVRNISGRLVTDSQQGTIDVDSRNAFFHLKRTFSQPWHYDSLKGRLKWKLIQGDIFSFSSPDIEMTHQSGKKEGITQGRVRINLEIPFDHRPANMRLYASLSNINTREAAAYLPSRVMSPKLNNWLINALPEGHVSKGVFQWDGSLSHHNSHLPWALDISVDNTRFHYSPDWPEIKNMSARVKIDDKGLTVKNATGKMYHSTISDINASMEDFNRPVLALSAMGKLTGNDFLHLLKSPVITTALHGAPNEWKIDGNFETTLALSLPLDHKTDEKPDINVKTKTVNGCFEVPEKRVRFGEMNGEIVYSTRKGLSSENLRARFLNNPAEINIDNETIKETAHITYVNIKSHANFKEFAPFIPEAAMSLASGDFNYQLRLGITEKKGYFVDLQSDLDGLSLDLPLPFKKAPDEKRDFYLLVTPGERDNKHFLARYGNLLQASFFRNNNKVTGGTIVFNPQKGLERVILKDNGLLLSGTLDDLDLSAWQAWYNNHKKIFPENSNTSESPTLSVKNLEIKRAQFKGYSMEGVNIDGNIGHNVAKERVEDDKKTNGPLNGSKENKSLAIVIQKLSFPEKEAKKNEKSGEPEKPLSVVKNLPPLTFSAKQIDIGPKKYGFASFEVVGNSRGLRLKNINALLGGVDIHGELSWNETRENKIASGFTGTLKTRNLGEVFKNWNYTNHSFTAKEAEINVSGDWEGSPQDFDFSKSTGHAKISFKNGQFDGAGNTASLHIFGLLNINTIARRLRLDFSDLFDSGVTFDAIDGKVSFEHGLIDLDSPLTINGPSSSFIFNGAVNVPQQYVDLGMIVTLPLTQNLPVISLLLGQPAIAGAIYLFDKLAGKKLMKFSSVRYEIKGPLSNPSVTMDKLFSNKLKKESASSAKNEAAGLHSEKTKPDNRTINSSP